MSTSTVSIPKGLHGRDFLTLKDFSSQDILALLDYAAYLKAERKAGRPHRLLEGKQVALYFEKPSNRTRVSFEVGVADLGANAIYLRKEEINLGVRETIADTARTLSRYVDAIMIRTFAQKDVEELGEWATVPVINGLTDAYHPCQTLADLLTFKEFVGSFQGKRLTYVGDGNNVCHSLLFGCSKVGLDIAVATPKGYEPDPAIVDIATQAAQVHGSQVMITNDLTEAVKGSHAVYADVWASMGQEGEAATKNKAFTNYQVNGSILSYADPNVIVLHCLPAHRGEEITHEVVEAHAKSIFEQAENRLHAQKAVMVALMKPSS